MRWGGVILGSGVSSPKTVDDLRPIILCALENNINTFDTAPSYRTESVIGAVLKSLGVQRKFYHIQTKIDAWQMVEGNIAKHVHSALKSFDTEYIDSLLIHWPLPEELNRTWEQMIELKNYGLVNRIGICNVRMRQLKNIAKYEVMPDIIQIERNPLRVCSDEVNFCHENNIELQAYSPLCKMNHKLSDSDIIKALAEKYNITSGQLIMRWHLQTGCVPIFATHSPERVKEFAKITNFELDDNDCALISSLNCDYKMYLESFACPGF